MDSGTWKPSKGFGLIARPFIFRERHGKHLCNNTKKMNRVQVPLFRFLKLFRYMLYLELLFLRHHNSYHFVYRSTRFSFVIIYIFFIYKPAKETRLCLIESMGKIQGYLGVTILTVTTFI